MGTLPYPSYISMKTKLRRTDLIPTILGANTLDW